MASPGVAAKVSSLVPKDLLRHKSDTRIVAAFPEEITYVMLQRDALEVLTYLSG